MCNYDFVIRENGFPESYQDMDSYLDTEAIIKDNYPYIYECMENESYIIENSQCNILNELLCDNRVVGFVSFDILSTGSFLLNEFYVLPEFRDTDYLLDEIKTVLESGEDIGICNPNHLIIDKLLEYGFAREVTDNLVLSGINLLVPSNSVVYKEKPFKIDDEGFYLSSVYDTNISAVLLFDTEPKSKIYYSKALNYDIIHFDAGNIRSRLKKTYFSKIIKTLNKNNDEHNKIVKELKDNLPIPDYTIEEIVGVAPEFSNYLNMFMIGNQISHDDAVRIQKQLTEEYEEGKVLSKNLYRRLVYLVMQDKLPEATYDSDDLSCPYCNLEVNIMDEYCSSCGYNLHIDDIASVDYDFSTLNEGFLKALIFSLEQLQEPHSLESICIIATILSEININDLYKYILENDLISNKFNEHTWYASADNITVPQLKDILRKNNLKVSGRKSELMDRIASNVDLSTINVSDYSQNVSDECDDTCTLSTKGVDYLLKYYEYKENNEEGTISTNNDVLGEYNGFGLKYIDRRDDETFDFLKFLKKKNFKLYKSLKKEYPNIKLNDEYDYYTFYEKNGKTMGFGLIKKFSVDYHFIEFTLEFLFILDEYKQDISIFDDVLYGNVLEMAIHNPSRCLIEKMLSEGYGERLNERFVDTQALLLFDAINPDDALNITIKSNEDVKKLENVKEYNIDCALYDLKLCSPACRTSDFYMNNTERYAEIGVAHEEDNIKYNCLKERQNDPWIQEGTYNHNIQEFMNIEEVESKGFFGYSIIIDDDNPVTEDYYYNKQYKKDNNPIYKEFFQEK